MDEFFEGSEVVVHLAGVNELKSAIQPELGLQTSILATQRVAEVCRSAGVKRLIYVSTWLVYGASIQPGVLLTEDSAAKPRNAYSVARLASEHIAASIAQDRFELVVLRLTNAVGPPVDHRIDRWSLLTNDLCRQAISTGRMELRSSGLQWRDFVPMREIIKVIELACGTDPRRSPFLPAGTYNLASGSPSTVLDFANRIRRTLEEELGKRVPLNRPPHTDEQTEMTVVSPSALNRFTPTLQADLDEAIIDTVRFCLASEEEWAP